MRTKNSILNVITGIILQFVIIFTGFVIPKIIIDNFGSSVNGLVTSITQFLGYISLLQAGFGMIVKSLLYKPIANKNKIEIHNILFASEKFFKKIAKIFLIYILILSIFYPLLVNDEFSFLYTFSLIIIISISIFAEYYFGMTFTLYLQSCQKSYIIALIQIITYILSVLVVIILVYFNFSIHVVKLISALIFVLRPLILNIYVKKKYKVDYKNCNEKYNIKNKWEGLTQHLAYTVNQSTDMVLLTIFRSLAEISVYSVYRMIASGIESIINAVANGISASFGDMIAKNELEKINSRFSIYETIYILICSILYSCAFVMIIPFIRLYTNNVTDINYVNYLFGYLVLISSFIFIFRAPYNELIKSAGLFKETRNFAILEAVINIILSLLLIKKFGLVGITIGTIVAVSIRTIDMVYKSNKLILHRDNFSTIKKLLLSIFIMIFIFELSKFLPLLNNSTYFNWIVNSIIIATISIFVVAFFSFILYKQEFKILFKLLFKVFRKR